MIRPEELTRLAFPVGAVCIAASALLHMRYSIAWRADPVELNRKAGKIPAWGAYKLRIEGTPNPHIEENSDGEAYFTIAGSTGEPFAYVLAPSRREASELVDLLRRAPVVGRVWGCWWSYGEGAGRRFIPVVEFEPSPTPVEVGATASGVFGIFLVIASVGWWVAMRMRK